MSNLIWGHMDIPWHDIKIIKSLYQSLLIKKMCNLLSGNLGLVELIKNLDICSFDSPDSPDIESHTLKCGPEHMQTYNGLNLSSTIWCYWTNDFVSNCLCEQIENGVCCKTITNVLPQQWLLKFWTHELLMQWI